MSLILDALRKLEREKEAREPGVLVVGSVPWDGGSRARRLVPAAVALAGLALAAVVGWLLWPAPKAPAAVAQPSAASPSPEPAPSASPALRPVTLPLPAPRQTTPAPAPPIRLSRPLPPAAPTASSASVEPTAEPLSPRSAAEGTGETPPATRPGELRLTAISQRDGRPVALINDRLVFEGDSFEGVRVLRIGETEVEVEVKGQRRVLSF